MWDLFPADPFGSSGSPARLPFCETEMHTVARDSESFVWVMPKHPVLSVRALLVSRSLTPTDRLGLGL